MAENWNLTQVPLWLFLEKVPWGLHPLFTRLHLLEGLSSPSRTCFLPWLYGPLPTEQPVTTLNPQSFPTALTAPVSQTFSLTVLCYCRSGGSVHGISQARILECVATSSSRGSSWPRDWTQASCFGRRLLYHWAAWEDSHALVATFFPEHSNSSPRVSALGAPHGGNAYATSFSFFKSQLQFHSFRSLPLTILKKRPSHLPIPTPTLSVATLNPITLVYFLMAFISLRNEYTFTWSCQLSPSINIEKPWRERTLSTVSMALSLEPSKARHSDIFKYWIMYLSLFKTKRLWVWGLKSSRLVRWSYLPAGRSHLASLN